MRLSFLALLAAGLAAFSAGCAQHGVLLPASSLPPAYAARAASAIASPDLIPPKCKGQKDDKKRASLRVTLSTKGGSFCIPEFDGFGGSFEYPKLERSVVLTVRTSTSNIYNQRLLGSGTPILYSNLHFRASTHFAAHVKSKGGLTSAQIEPGEPYTAYGLISVGHLVRLFPPCYSDATKGRYGGLIPNIGGVLRNVTITGAGYGVIEIYSGKQVSQEC
jgi:hypothetical protein